MEDDARCPLQAARSKRRLLAALTILQNSLHPRNVAREQLFDLLLDAADVLGNGVVGSGVLRPSPLQPDNQPHKGQQHANVGSVHAIPELG